MSSLLKAMRQSARVFAEHVWPIIEPWIGGGKLVPIETVTDSEIAQQLDMLAGIDAWQIHADGICGIASRVQAGKAAIDPKTGRPWKTFTVRERKTSGARTEYAKRKDAIETGRWLYPILTVQAYVTDWNHPEILSVGMAKTTDIIACIDKDLADLKPTHEGDAWFYAVGWGVMWTHDYPIKIYTKDKGTFTIGDGTIWSE